MDEDGIGDKIEVFSNIDERLRFLGKLLNSDNSKEIMSLLVERELSSNEIAQQLHLSLPLVIHHLKKMNQAGMVRVARISRNSKNHPVKHYRAKSAIVILPEKTAQKARQSKTFLKVVAKFSAIGSVGILSGLTSHMYVPVGEPMPEDVMVGHAASPFLTVDVLMPVTIGLSAIVVGLIIERIYPYIKNRKSR